MVTAKALLNSIPRVKQFVNTVSGFYIDMDLLSGRYVVDAKSIMGIFSLSLVEELQLNIHTEDDDLAKTIIDELGDLVVEDSVVYNKDQIPDELTEDDSTSTTGSTSEDEQGGTSEESTSDDTKSDESTEATDDSTSITEETNTEDTSESTSISDSTSESAEDGTKSESIDNSGNITQE